MSRLRITPWENSQRTVDDLYADMERRISAAASLMLCALTVLAQIAGERE